MKTLEEIIREALTEIASLQKDVIEQNLTHVDMEGEIEATTEGVLWEILGRNYIDRLLLHLRPRREEDNHDFRS